MTVFSDAAGVGGRHACHHLLVAHPDRTLLTTLNAEIDNGLRVVLGGARRVALVNFPNRSTPGDLAIWLGTRIALRRLGVRVAYQCAWDTCSVTALRKAVPDGPVLINGGGNFGDLYGGQQGLRERLLAELRGIPIVQLPQSIHFEQAENLERVRRLVAAHGKVTLLVREHRSEKLARDHFDADVRLVPDMALALGPLPRLGTPEVDVTWLHWNAGDREYVEHGGPPEGVSTRVVNWVGPLEDEPKWSPRQRFARKANTVLRARAQRDPDFAARAWRPLGATFVPLSKAWVWRGLHVLGSGRVLVTDKLHGHLLALLAGIPHVALDNSYGKVSGVYQAYTHGSSLVRWAEDGDMARALALELLR